MQEKKHEKNGLERELVARDKSHEVESSRQSESCACDRHRYKPAETAGDYFAWIFVWQKSSKIEKTKKFVFVNKKKEDMQKNKKKNKKRNAETTTN